MIAHNTLDSLTASRHADGRLTLREYDDGGEVGRSCRPRDRAVCF